MKKNKKEKINWTTDVPAETGWYWLKYKHGRQIKTVPCSVVYLDHRWLVTTAKNDSFSSMTRKHAGFESAQFGPKIVLQEPEPSTESIKFYAEVRDKNFYKEVDFDYFSGRSYWMRTIHQDGSEADARKAFTVYQNDNVVKELYDIRLVRVSQSVEILE